MLLTSANDSDYNVTLSTVVSSSSYERFVTVLQTTVIAVISAGIILSNIINLIVLVSASAAMPWATRLFLINLSSSDLLVGLIACAPAVLPAAIDRWTYGDVWCQVSGVFHGTSCCVSIWSISMVGLHRYVATELPFRYRKLAAKQSRCFVIVVGLWTAALITFIAPILTKPDWTYYRYNVNQKMCGIYWEYPLYCVITAVYIPILSGAVLIFTGLRIRATLRRRRDVQLRLHHNTSPTSRGVDCQPSVVRRCYAVGSRRTLKIITLASVAYFACWSPYSILTLVQTFFRSFQPPSAVEFAVMWLANTNSALNVFIYSSTNAQFRRQCVTLVSRLCCSRLSFVAGDKQPSQSREGNVSTSLPAANLSTINVRVLAAADTNLPDEGVTWSADNRDGVGVQLLAVPRDRFLTVEHMKQAVSIETLASDETDSR